MSEESIRGDIEHRLIEILVRAIFALDSGIHDEASITAAVDAVTVVLREKK